VSGPARRVVAGPGPGGRSAVIMDGPVEAGVVRPNGAVVEEIWRHEQLPAIAGGNGVTSGKMSPMPPVQGASIRLFSLPPEGSPESGAPPAGHPGEADDAGDVPVRGDGRPALHRADSLYVATVVSGAAYLLLEEGEVLLRAGDSLVLQGVLHAWRNPFAETATLCCAVFSQVGAGG
jgi:hypothetical protein